MIAVCVDESDGAVPVISTSVQSSPIGEDSAPVNRTEATDSPRILGLQVTHFALIVVVVFLVGFFAV